jgi:hypothetical protein
MGQFILEAINHIKTPKKQPDAIIAQKNNDMHRLRLFLFLSICAFGILFFVAYAFWKSPRDWLSVVIGIFLACVAITPVVSIHFFLNGLKLFAPRFIFYFGSILIIFIGCYVYYHGQFVDIGDAYSALAFVFLPPLQIILLGGIFLFCKAIEAIIRKKNANIGV